MRLLPVFLSLLLLLAGCAQQTQPSAPQGNAAAPQQPSAPSQPSPAQPNATQQPAAPAQPSVPGIPGKNFTYYSSGWQLYGTEYASEDNSPTVAVILVGDLGQDRYSYPAGFIERIHTSMPNALVVAIDPRGSGQSTNLGTYQSFSSANYKDMRNDISDLGTKYLADSHPSLKQYYVVGAGMGSTAAILATAQEHRIVKVAMLSPSISNQGVDISSTIPGYKQEIFVAYTTGDTASSQSASRIASIASELQLTTKSYSGSASGIGIFDATAGSSPSLSEDLINFLQAS